MFRRIALVVIAVVSALAVVAVPSAAAAPGYCGIEWGSQLKQVEGTTGGHLTDIRAGQHDCFDRLVLDIPEGRADGQFSYFVNYVAEMRADFSGTLIPLRGGANLLISVRVPAYEFDQNNNTRETYTFPDRNELVDVTGFSTFRQLAWANSWEGTSTVGLGVRAQLPFRVFSLPGRLVVDVAHHW